MTVRADESDKGFAIFAQKIETLADQADQLNKEMGVYLEKIRSA